MEMSWNKIISQSEAFEFSQNEWIYLTFNDGGLVQ